ncbi:uncharacterized protein LOC144036137 [Vanacampus margaritifer]
MTSRSPRCVRRAASTARPPTSRRDFAAGRRMDEQDKKAGSRLSWSVLTWQETSTARRQQRSFLFLRRVYSSSWSWPDKVQVFSPLLCTNVSADGTERACKVSHPDEQDVCERLQTREAERAGLDSRHKAKGLSQIGDLEMYADVFKKY